MNPVFFVSAFFRNGITPAFFNAKRPTQTFFMIIVFLSPILLVTPVQATESAISILDTWVEDGYLFHVALEAAPTNTQCELHGEGLIEFEVVYGTQNMSGLASVFGVALWYPEFETADRIETLGQAVGPQAFCTDFSPCRIQEVHIVNAWCPVTNGRL